MVNRPTTEIPVKPDFFLSEIAAVPFGEAGGMVLRVCLSEKFKGKPDEGNLHVRFEEGESDERLQGLRAICHAARKG